MKRMITSAALASALVLSACGASEEEEAKQSLSTYLMDQQKQAQMIDLEQKDADCIADGMVDGIGVDQLQEYGLLNEDLSVRKDAKPPEMSREDAEALVDSMFDCTDVMATMKKELSAALGGQKPEVRQCFDEALDEQAVRNLLVANFRGQQEKAQQGLMTSLGQCITQGMKPPAQ